MIERATKMLFGLFVFILLSAVQFFCIKSKRKIVKVLPLLLGLLLIGVSIALMMWSFSLPAPTDTTEFMRQDSQFTTFFGFFMFGVYTVIGGLLSWLFYGVVLLVHSKTDKKTAVQHKEG